MSAWVWLRGGEESIPVIFFCFTCHFNIPIMYQELRRRSPEHVDSKFATKRAKMGEVARKLADLSIVTDDNPRSEDPAKIRKAILEACPGAREIGDRGEAIHTAVSLLDAGDTLLIAGKGHETGQTVGDEVIAFDDGETARQALARREGGS